MNNSILSIKRTNAIFLATLLVAGTIALSSPSSFMVGAQAVPQYGMEREYGSYEPEYTDRNNYEPTVKGYGNENSYENRKSYKTNSYEPTIPSYGNDKNNQKIYGNDNNYDKSQYQSYKPDYKPAYPSYGKDNNSYKSKKDSSGSVSINKLNCINNNVNINGNNNGTINVGNSGSSGTGDEGYVGVGSLGGNYGEGYSKQNKGFDCIINNNNINIISGNNQTEQLTCEECFTENLSTEQLNNLTQFLSLIPNLGNLEGLCEQLSNATLTNPQKVFGLVFLFIEAGITDETTILQILECLEELGLIIVPPNLERPNDINTAGGLASSFSSPPIIAQGTEEDLSALEKTTKLKQQWMELLP